MKNIIDETIKLLLKDKQTQKQSLYEFAMSKRFIIDKLYDIRLTVNEHLICCYLWNRSENISHWKKEIGNFIKKQPPVKGTNKYPTEKQLHKWVIDDTIEEVKTSIDGIIKRTEEDEEVSIKNCDKMRIQHYLIDFWNWLAYYIADGKEVSRYDIYQKIDSLIQKYKG